MDIDAVLGQGKADWRVRNPTPLAGSKLPEPILGDEEGAVEWHDQDKSARTFVRMDTYDDLRNPRALFLFGRRGTGKTTYLRMLDHEVKADTVNHYSTSCILDSQPLVLGMSAQVRSSPLAGLPDAELAEALVPVWTWVITIAAMQSTLEARTPTADEPVELKRLRAFVSDVLGPEREHTVDQLRDRMHDLLAMAVGRGPWTAMSGDVINGINKVFADAEFHRASELLAKALLSRPALVMLDAGDVYSVQDPVPSATITALIASITRLASSQRGHALYAKAAFPSEILPHVYAFNRGKMQNHIVVISWTYRDLVSLLAKRFHALTLDNKLSTAGRASEELPLDLIYRTLPAMVESRVGIPFDTLAYIIRHTQRTPRQVVMLVNSVLTHSKTKGWAPGKPIADGQAITHGVHLYLGHLVNDSIDMHRSIYQRLDEVVQGTLARRPCYFKAVELNKFIKEISELRHSSGWDRADVVRMLFEVGVIGIANEAHLLGHSVPPRYILEALYEYQVKETLRANDSTYCVVHPMFYEWLGTKVDAGKFVYPVAFEDEDKEVLKKYGARPSGEA